MDNSMAVITDVQKFSVHDGPGIRTLIFFKGCPLKCQWCQNPETWRPEPQIMYTQNACIHCGACISACAAGAIHPAGSGIAIDPDRCRVCGSCTNVCYAEALKKVGRRVSIEDLMNIILEDEAFYGEQGGVTLSGGEILMQADFAAELLKTAKARRIHTAIETCGFGSREKLLEIAKFCDLVLYDVKHMDPEFHRRYTGYSNERILSNLEAVVATGTKVIIRIPYIPGVNASDENIRQTGRLAKRLGVAQVHLLPFHTLGESKWNGLSLDYPFSSAPLPDGEMLRRSAKILEDMGVSVNIGGYAG